MNAERHQGSVTARFSAASATYHRHAEVQEIVARRLLSLISAPQSVDRILEIGSGTGLLTQLLIERFPTVMIHAVDISEEMATQARQRLSKPDRIQQFICDLRAFDPPIPYPLVVSSSSMHWISPVEEGFKRIAGLLEPGGDVVLSLMLHGTLGELRTTRLSVAPHKPPLGRLPLAEEVLYGLENAGLRVTEKVQETLRAHHASAEAFLRAIHEQGVTGGEVSASNCPLTRGELQRLKAEYEARYHNGKGVRASYKVMYLKATKPTPG